MENIKIWLNDPSGDYSVGLQLLQNSSKNRVLLSGLLRKQNFAKLRYELAKIAGCNLIVTPSVELKPKPLGFKPNELLRMALNGEKTVHEIPPVIMDVFEGSIELYRIMRSHHEGMKVATTDSSRADLRSKLLSAEVLYSKSWDIIDHWAATGEVPQVEPEPTQSSSVNFPDAEPTSKAVNAANVALNRDLLSLKSTKNETKRSTKIESIKKNVAVLLAAGVEFKEKRRNQLIELGIL